MKKGIALILAAWMAVTQLTAGSDLVFADTEDTAPVAVRETEETVSEAEQAEETDAVSVEETEETSPVAVEQTEESISAAEQTAMTSVDIDQDDMVLPQGGIEEANVEWVPESEISPAAAYDIYSGDEVELEMQLANAIRDALRNQTPDEDGQIVISLYPYLDQYKIPYDSYEDIAYADHLSPYVGDGITVEPKCYTKYKTDESGNIVKDGSGNPVKVPDYWSSMVIKVTLTSEELAAHMAKVDQALQEVYAQVNDSMTDVQKALAIHDYICSQVTYLDDESTYEYYAYACLVKQQGVCMSYAHLYAYVMNTLGVNCRYVSSSTMNHGWNIIRIGGNYYQVDCTWDDPVNGASGDHYYGGADHKYFLLSDATMMDSSHNHKDWNHTELVCSDTSYESEYWISVKSPIVQIGDSVYYISFGTNSAGLYRRDADGTATQLDSFYWFVWGSTSSCYTSSFSGLFQKGDYLIYNTATQIKAYSLTDGSLAVAAEPDTSTGYIYGIRTKGSEVLYQLRTIYSETNPCQSIELNLEFPATAVTLDQTLLTMEPDSKQTIKAAVTPTCTTDTVSWKSSDTGVAVVSDQGLVTAKEVGTAEITVTAGKVSAACTVNVAHCGKTELKNASEADCLHAGYTGDTYCSGCDQLLSKGADIPAPGHDYQVTATEKDCINGDLITYTCSRCGDTYTNREAARQGHEIDTWTSNGDGSHSGTCRNCGTQEQADCSYDYSVITAPTYHESGVGRYTCRICGYSYDEEIPANVCDHASTELRGQYAADCLNAGYTGDTYCAICGDLLSKGTEIPALGHAYGDWTVDQAAACEAEGSRSEVCSRCGDVQTEAIPATGHTAGDPVKENVTEAECESDGSYELATYCQTCGKELSRDKTETAALGHRSDEGKHSNENAATCEKAGSYTEVFTCERCKKILSSKIVEIPALGHDWDQGTTTKEASCTEEGVKTYSCSRCRGTQSESIPALGHDWDQGKITKAAACTETGEKTFTCSRCGETNTMTLEALGHSWEEGIVTKEASCTEEGIMTYHCTRCDEKKTEAIAMKVRGSSTVTLTAKTAYYTGKAIQIGKAKVTGSTGSVAYCYYTDSACTKKTTSSDGASAKGSAPKYVGTYYVRAQVARDQNYKAKTSAAVTLIITPKAVSLKSLTAASKAFTAKWTAYTKQTTGYQIQYSTSSKFTSAKHVTVKDASAASQKISSLKGNKKYYVRIRAYYKKSGDKNYYSSWSAAKTVTTKA